ncbi:hypothetical protein, partial [Staphylococcus aureus]|uniref:hypothetical protein n=1 Tax=Staphylococcus aureus TaxID=1280 RepID=UPI0039BE8A02
FAAWLGTRGIVLRVARLKDTVHDLLMRAALPQLPPQALDYWSVEDAVSTATAISAQQPNGTSTQ